MRSIEMRQVRKGNVTGDEGLRGDDGNARGILVSMGLGIFVSVAWDILRTGQNP